VARKQGGRPVAVFYRFGHPLPYAYDGRDAAAALLIKIHTTGSVMVAAFIYINSQLRRGIIFEFILLAITF
jgi:hypothetical protein